MVSRVFQVVVMALLEWLLFSFLFFHPFPYGYDKKRDDSYQGIYPKEYTCCYIILYYYIIFYKLFLFYSEVYKYEQ